MLNPLFLKQTASDTHFASTTTIIVQQLNTAKSFMSLFFTSVDTTLVNSSIKVHDDFLCINMYTHYDEKMCLWHYTNHHHPLVHFLINVSQCGRRRGRSSRSRKREQCVEMSRRRGMIINGSTQLLDVPIVHCFLRSSFLLPKRENKVYRHQNDLLFIYMYCTILLSMVT